MTNRTSIYIKNKYTKIYFSIIEKAKTSNIIGYTEKHHIIPRSFGGSDDKSNLVKLTARQHYICHLLLTKMVEYNSPEYHKMIKAYMLMAWYKGDNQDRSYKINSRIFDSLKVEFSKAQSISQSGENNAGYGSTWLYNPILKENKRINKDDAIESGWVKGRVTDWNTHFTQRKCKHCDKIGTMSRLSMYCSNECKKSTMTSNIHIDDIILNGISVDNDCHIWLRSTYPNGYPCIEYKGKNTHLTLYIINKYIKKTKSVKNLNHICGNKKCLNTNHMIIKNKKR